MEKKTKCKYLNCKKEATEHLMVAQWHYEHWCNHLFRVCIEHKKKKYWKYYREIADKQGHRKWSAQTI